MRILITGAAGFIGSQITRRLARDGHEILAVDNLSFGRESSLPEEAVLKRLDLAACSSTELMEAVEGSSRTAPSISPRSTSSPIA